MADAVCRISQSFFVPRRLSCDLSPREPFGTMASDPIMDSSFAMGVIYI